ncbi:VP2 [Orca polyomavirus]|nr:VP2 [Orca polyomavirus]
MGAFVSVLVELITAATELSALTGFTLDALLTGEAAAALEAELSSLMIIEGLSEAEALLELGVTAEQLVQIGTLSSSLESAVGFGVFFQTVSGFSSLISAGIRMGMEFSSVNRDLSDSELTRILGDIAKILPTVFKIDPLNLSESLDFFKNFLTLPLKVRHAVTFLILNSKWVVTNSTFCESGDIVNFHGNLVPDWLLFSVLRINGSQEKDAP